MALVEAGRDDVGRGGVDGRDTGAKEGRREDCGEDIDGPTPGVELPESSREFPGRRSFFGRTRRRLIDGILDAEASGESSHFDLRLPGLSKFS